MVNKENSLVGKDGKIPLGLGLYLHKRAARLTQTSGRSLTYWTNTNLIAPQIHCRNGGPSVYAYNDLLAIRAVVRLRRAGLPLQQVRRAIEYLYETLGSQAEWWNLKMVVDRRDLLVVIPKDISPTSVDEVVVATRGGQKPFELSLADLVNDLLSGGELGEYPKIREYISIDGRFQGGAPVIKGTRIKTNIIAFWFACSLSSAEISEIYGGLDKDAIQAAITYESLLNGHN